MNATSPRVFLEAACDDPALRRIVFATVRRSVPASDAEDVVQSVFCDALGSTRIPPPSEVAAWLIGIARHKAMDYWRGRRAHASIEDVEVARAPEPFEARDLLARVIAESSADPRARETLGWLVREHDGEPLASIAARERIGAPAVRKRVSRLRRALRLRWAAVLVCTTFAATAAWRWHATRPLIVAEPSASPLSSAALAGRWNVEAVEVASWLDPAAAAATEAKARAATVEVGEGALVVRGWGDERRFALSLRSSGALLVGRIDGEKQSIAVQVQALSGGRLVVDLEGVDATRVVLGRTAP